MDENQAVAENPDAASGLADAVNEHKLDTTDGMIGCEIKGPGSTLKSEFMETKVKDDVLLTAGAMKHEIKAENESEIKPNRASSVPGNIGRSEVQHATQNKTKKIKMPKQSPSICKKSKKCKRKLSATSLNTSPKKNSIDEKQVKKRRKVFQLGGIFQKVKTRIFRKKSRHHIHARRRRSVENAANKQDMDTFSKSQVDVVKTKPQDNVNSNDKGNQEKQEDLGSQSQNTFEREQDTIVSEIDDAALIIEEMAVGSRTSFGETKSETVSEDITTQTLSNRQRTQEQGAFIEDKLCDNPELYVDNRETDTETPIAIAAMDTEISLEFEQTDTELGPHDGVSLDVCNKTTPDKLVSVCIDQILVDTSSCKENEKVVCTGMAKECTETQAEKSELDGQTYTVLVPEDISSLMVVYKPNQDEAVSENTDKIFVEPQASDEKWLNKDSGMPYYISVEGTTHSEQNDAALIYEDNKGQLTCNEKKTDGHAALPIDIKCSDPQVSEDNTKTINLKEQTDGSEENRPDHSKDSDKAIAEKSNISLSPRIEDDDIVKNQIKLKRQLMCDIMNSAIVKLKKGQWFHEEKITRKKTEEAKTAVEVAGDDLIATKTIEVRDVAEMVVDISNLLPDDVVKIVSKLREQSEQTEDHFSYPEYEFLTDSEMERRLETVQMQVNGGGRKAYHDLVKLAAEQKAREKVKAQNLETSPDGEDHMVYYRANDIIKLARKMHYGGYKGKRYRLYIQQEKEKKEKKDKEEKSKSEKEENLEEDSEKFTDCSEFSENDPECINHNANKRKEVVYGQDLVLSDTDTASNDTESDYHTCDDDSHSDSDESRGEDRRSHKRRTKAEILVQHWSYDDKRERVIDKDWVRWRSGKDIKVEPKVKRKENVDISPLERKIRKNMNKKSFFLGRWRLNRSHNATIDQVPSQEDQTDWEMLKQLLLADEKTSIQESYHGSHEEIPVWQRKRIRHIPTLY